MTLRCSLFVCALILITALPADAAVHVWTGAASDRFSDAGNWIGGSPAGDTDVELSFPSGVARTTVTNDLTSLTVRTLSFSGPYVLSGNALTLAPSGEVLDTLLAPIDIRCDLQLTGGVRFLTRGESTLNVSGAISGVGPLITFGGGRAILSGSSPNTYSGGTQVLSSELRLGKKDGVDAIGGDLTIGTQDGSSDNGLVTTVTNEQIPDTATIQIFASNTLGIGGVETVGPLQLRGGARLQTAIPGNVFTSFSGTLILSGDVLVTGAGSNPTTFNGDIALQGSRTITSCEGCAAIQLSRLREATPGAGLTIRGTAASPGRVEITGSYQGPTVIEGGEAAIIDRATAVTLRGGSFSGNVRSLIAERGIVDARNGLTTEGELRLSGATTLRLLVPRPFVSTPLITAVGPVDITHAELDIEIGPRLTSVLGTKYIVVQNYSNSPIRGTFARVAQGALLANRFVVSYNDGDGNDLTMTDGGRFRTFVQLLSSGDSPLVAGSSATLTAALSIQENANRVATGDMKFFEGDTLIGSVPIVPGVFPTLTIQPSYGTHQYTARYSGSAELLPSEASVTVRTSPPVPTITALEPSTAPNGVATEFTLRGSNFIAAGTVMLSSSYNAAPTSVTDSEVHFVWTPPASETDLPLNVWYSQQYGPSSNQLPLLVKGSPQPKTELTFETLAVSGRVIPGGGATWFSVANTQGQNGVVHEHRGDITPDSDRDGIVRWTLTQGVPTTGIWLMTDMTDGRIVAGRRDGGVPAPVPFPKAMLLRDSSGHYSHVVLPSYLGWNLIWVRPHVGAWTLLMADGGGGDRDGVPNGLLVVNTSQLHPIATSPAIPPAGIEPGDSFMAIEEGSLSWFGDHADEHLHDADGVAGALRFATKLPIVPEKNGVAHVTVMRIGGSDGSISVNYSTRNNTALAGVNYLTRAGTLTFGPGEILQTIDVPLIDDTTYSGSTSFDVVLSDPAGTTIVGGDTAAITIFEDDPIPQITISSDVSIDEGDEGDRDTNLTVTVTGSTRLPITVKWSATLLASYAPSGAGTLTFLPGGPTTQTIPFRVAANRMPENDRVFGVTLQPITNALPSSLQRKVTIVDDDFAELTIADATVSESQASVAVTISSPAAIRKDISFDYTTVSGSATAGVDFKTTTGKLTSGNTQIVIPLIGDTTAEGDETFTIVLSNVKGARPGRSAATVVILDDDGEPRLPVLSVAPVVAAESNSTGASFHVALSFPSATDVRFRAVTVAGSASDTTDFRPVDSVITIRAGQTDAYVNVGLRESSDTEPVETFTLVLSEPVGATIATPSVTCTILDTDPNGVDPSAATLVVSDTTIAEGNSGFTTARFKVDLSRALVTPATVQWTTADGSASAMSDYVAASGTLTFAPGETSKNIDVRVVGDQQFENDETFTLVLGNAVNARIGSAAAVCFVTNDDAAIDRRRSARH